LSKALDGQDEICTFMRCAWPRIQVLIDKFGFPAKKVEGRWLSDTELIEKWRKGIIEEDGDNSSEIS